MKKILILVVSFICIYNHSHCQEIEFLSPKMNTSWYVGSQEQIKWKYKQSSDANVNPMKIKIEFRSSNNQNWSEVGNDIDASTEIFKWVIPDKETINGQLRLSIMGKEFISENFSIIGQDKQTLEIKEKPNSFQDKLVNLGNWLTELEGIFTSDSASKLKRDSVTNIVIIDKLYSVWHSLDSGVKKTDTLSRSISKKYLSNYKKRIEELANSNTSIETEPQSRIIILGDAAIIKSGNVSEEENKKNASIIGNGSFGINYVNKKENFEVKAFLILLSTADTIKSVYDGSVVSNKSNFGNSILVPSFGSNTFKSGSIEFTKSKTKVFNTLTFFLPEKWQNSLNNAFSLYSKFSLSSQVWSDSITTEGANILSSSVGFIWNIFSYENKEREDLQFKVNFLLTNRSIFGDISKNDSLRIKLLDSDDTVFWGADIGFSIVYRSFAGFISFTDFWNKGVRGLTFGELVAGLSLTAPFFEFPF